VNAMDKGMAYQPLSHSHSRTARQLEERGARRIIVPLRPMHERLVSGAKAHLKIGQRQRLGIQPGDRDAANIMVTAMRTSSSKRLRKAYWFTAAASDYLHNLDGTAKLLFLCANNMTAQFNELMTRLDLCHVNMSSADQVPTAADRLHKDVRGKPSQDQNPLTPENLAWVQAEYAEDYRLYAQHCPPWTA